MATTDEMEGKLWKALRSDMTMMLGLAQAEAGHLRPMTAQIEQDRSPIWFFTSRETELVRHLEGTREAVATFADKGHDLFATLRGTLTLDNDRVVIDRLWNRFVAAWFEDGKDDPKLALLRFDAREAEVWLNEYSLVAGVKLLLGADPKADYQDKTATVRLDD
ncbi:pyridoxamine 5'-phosphate oxidase family protein [Pseudoxanthomonas mexicana]|uniref:pyridoxamine 5'-phosphate oxidase family protein n=1 Tax=Pseudoxanthomonas mexicana TaxID=128785 RepID=UPI00398AA036